jgi:hypothetical protein
METIRKNRKSSGRLFSSSHCTAGAEQQSAACSQTNVFTPVSIDGLLPLWGGPTLPASVQRKYYESLDIACQHAGIKPQYFHSQPLPRNITLSFQSFKEKLVGNKKYPGFELSVIAAGKDKGRIRKYYILGISDPCFIPIDQVYAMYIKGENPALINLLLCTLAYLHQVCKFDGCNSRNCTDNYLDIALDSLEEKGKFARDVKRFCKNAKKVTQEMGKLLENSKLLQDWPICIDTFQPQNEQEKIYLSISIKLHALYQQYPLHNIFTGWLTNGEGDEDWVVYPEHVYAFIYMDNILHHKLDANIHDRVSQYLIQCVDSYVNCIFNESLYGLIYDHEIIYKPGADLKEPDFAFQIKLHELVYDLSYEIRKLL